MSLFLNSGQLVATSDVSLSWRYRYALTVAITDITGDQDSQMSPMLLCL